ncbi:MAG: ABC transporter permease [Lachnospiraceae bacterium]|nr:ABC transporter permease [Lachnospiraceae bacterium]MBP5415632.1 ABC transporter permease [Lachnospiraceae bacterium]MBP5746723.1 ABC transporter permease [Lachnospiraceae bacterium]
MKYVLKKVLSCIITLFIVSLLVFVAFSLIPGDPALSRLGTNATEAALASLRHQMGLDRPLAVRYFEWLASAIRGDFGKSYSYSMTVTSMIADKLPITLTLMLYSMVLMVIISVPLGVYASYKEGTAIDKVIQIINQITMAIPPFFSGILITLIFGMTLKMFTPGGFVSVKISPSRFFGFMFFPSLAIALPKSAMVLNLLYSSLNAEKKKDYVRTAYSRGNKSKTVFFGHMLKNASIPTITFLGMALADMIAGSIIIEQVFGIPGLGRILLTSIQNRDYPVVIAIIMLIACVVIVSNLLVDIIYKLVDPRVKD